MSYEPPHMQFGFSIDGIYIFMHTGGGYVIMPGNQKPSPFYDPEIDDSWELQGEGPLVLEGGWPN